MNGHLYAPIYERHLSAIAQNGYFHRHLSALDELDELYIFLKPMRGVNRKVIKCAGSIALFDDRAEQNDLHICTYSETLYSVINNTFTVGKLFKIKIF